MNDTTPADKPADSTSGATPDPPSDTPSADSTRYRIFPAQGQAFPENDPGSPVSPEDYKAKILPGLIKSTHDKPDLLHEVLFGALRIGAVEEATAGARRLVEIDGDSPRAVAMLSIALLQGKQVEEAEGLLRAHLEEHGSSAIVRLRLAQALHTKGDKEASEDSLWDALEEDPNHPDAVMWWGRIKHEEEAEGGFYRGMQQIDAIEGSWFAKLWMARMHLEGKDTATAVALYERCLPQAAAQADAMVMISADLGRAGCFEDVLRLVEPHYDPKRHGPGPGLNLAVACARSGQTERGTAMLDTLEAMGMAHLAPQLEQVRKLLAGEEPAPPPAEG